MKQKDIILIVMVVIVSGTFSFLLSKFLFTIPKDRQTTVEVVQPITSQFAQPSTQYFNNNSVDPTKNISIGDSQNTQPFSSGQ